MAAFLETFMRNRFSVSEERLTHCRQCEHFEPRSSRCARCGCFMNFKTLMPGAVCPLGKWDKIDIIDEEKKE